MSSHVRHCRLVVEDVEDLAGGTDGLGEEDEGEGEGEGEGEE